MILTHGEMLIDFIPTALPGSGDGKGRALAYRPAVGGSPGNVAVTIARLDVAAGFVGGLSTDFFGEQIAAHLAENGVAMDFVARMDRPSMLAFVDLEGEEPRYAFYDIDCAPRNWSLEAMPAIPPEVTALHFGSLSLIRLPAANAFAELVRREAGRRVISFDPNIRASLVEDEADYRARLDEIFSLADVIKLSQADLDWIAPGGDIASLAAEWLAAGTRIVVMTRGGDGATLYSQHGTIERPAMPITVVDTVGAGDSLMGGLLAALDDRNALDRERLAALGMAELAKVLEFALAVAAVNCSRVGADPPRRAELAPYVSDR